METYIKRHEVWYEVELLQRNPKTFVVRIPRLINDETDEPVILTRKRWQMRGLDDTVN